MIKCDRALENGEIEAIAIISPRCHDPRISLGENINLVGAKHFGRYFWVKSRDLLPKCFALDRAIIPIG